jgi:hypothetical protein
MAVVNRPRFRGGVVITPALPGDPNRYAVGADVWDTFSSQQRDIINDSPTIEIAASFVRSHLRQMHRDYSASELDHVMRLSGMDSVPAPAHCGICHEPTIDDVFVALTRPQKKRIIAFAASISDTGGESVTNIVMKEMHTMRLSALYTPPVDRRDVYLTHLGALGIPRSVAASTWDNKKAAVPSRPKKAVKTNRSMSSHTKNIIHKLNQRIGAHKKR